MEAYALTDIGRVRTMNQDYIYSSPEKVGSLPNLFLVADGMGGHRAGDYASRFAVENLVIYINRAGDGSPVMQLKKGIEAVNGMLYEESLKREELKGMGCTLVAGVVEDNILYVANVGDSRLYYYDGTLRQVTMDHSLVEELVRAGELDRAESRNHPQKNIITKAVGVSDTVSPDFFMLDIADGLCSDGLSNMVDDDKLEEIMAEQGEMNELARECVDEALFYGGLDNIAVVIAQCGNGR